VSEAAPRASSLGGIALPPGALPADASSSAGVGGAQRAAAAPAAPAAPTASARDPGADLFAEAHRLHFIARDPAGALAAWDRYLAAFPNGRFAPEARYNRALTLARLGRNDEAQAALRPFADGVYGDYHRADARALLGALPSARSQTSALPSARSQTSALPSARSQTSAPGTPR
jgi:hypothetical protein